MMILPLATFPSWILLIHIIVLDTVDLKPEKSVTFQNETSVRHTCTICKNCRHNKRNCSYRMADHNSPFPPDPVVVKHSQNMIICPSVIIFSKVKSIT